MCVAGTAVGDWISEGANLGYGNTVLLFAGAIVLVTLIWFFRKQTKANSVLCFWVAYILTRPLGASIGDFLSQNPADQVESKSEPTTLSSACKYPLHCTPRLSQVSSLPCSLAVDCLDPYACLQRDSLDRTCRVPFMVRPVSSKQRDVEAIMPTTMSFGNEGREFDSQPRS